MTRTTPFTPTLRRRAAAVLAAGVLTASLAGCATSLHDPDAHAGLGGSSTTATTTATSATILTTATAGPPTGGTVPAPIAKLQNGVTPGSALPTPQAALTRFAQTWGTWTSATIPAVQTRLAAMSIGSARDQAKQAIASYHADPQMRNGGLTSTTKVVAVAQGVGAAAGSWVVTVTEKLGGTGQADLPATLHVNYAKVTHNASGWVVSEWSPQN